jgi:hypothetical protein
VKEYLTAWIGASLKRADGNPLTGCEMRKQEAPLLWVGPPVLLFEFRLCSLWAALPD